ncbi:ATP-binding cassette domain-containing protein [Globicatella sp. HMSC072A10]|nr:ATP-binding cassette domain-containing protein [Globicatella sp. HMSC072A10]
MANLILELSLDELIMEGGNLSGGQKQRMIIIRAFSQNKKFIILD